MFEQISDQKESSALMPKSESHFFVGNGTYVTQKVYVFKQFHQQTVCKLHRVSLNCLILVEHTEDFRHYQKTIADPSRVWKTTKVLGRLVVHRRRVPAEKLKV